MFLHFNVLAFERKLLEDTTFICHDNKKKAFDYPIVSYLFGLLETVPFSIINCESRPLRKATNQKCKMPSLINL